MQVFYISSGLLELCNMIVGGMPYTSNNSGDNVFDQFFVVRKADENC